MLQEDGKRSLERQRGGEENPLIFLDFYFLRFSFSCHLFKLIPPPSSTFYEICFVVLFLIFMLSSACLHPYTQFNIYLMGEYFTRKFELSSTTLNDVKYHECGGLSTFKECCSRMRWIWQYFQFKPLWSQHFPVDTDNKNLFSHKRIVVTFMARNKKSNICCYWCLPTDSRR